jgi:hypothetical protein
LKVETTPSFENVSACKQHGCTISCAESYAAFSPILVGAQQDYVLKFHRFPNLNAVYLA